MRDDKRLQELHRNYGAVTVSRCPSFSRPSQPDFGATLCKDKARDLLARNRIDGSAYRDPGKGLKGILRTKSRKEEMSDTTKWVFTLNERRKALDQSFRNGDPVGLAQAIIEYHPTQPFDVNIHFEDESNNRKRKDLQLPRMTSSRWLEQAVTNNSLDYVRLFASRGARQQALNDALGIALSNNSRPIIEQLLLYGADPNNHSQAFQSAVEVNDIELVSLILQANSSKALNSDQLHPALLTAIHKRSYHMAALLLAHGANPGRLSGQPLVTALQSQDLRMLSMILVGCSETMSSELLMIATSLACEFQDIPLKVRCLELLLCAGAPTEGQIICNQLCVAVKTNQPDYISMLIQRGISPDYNGAEAVQLAVNELKVECLRELSKATLSTSNVSKAIDGIPENVSEKLALEIVDLLFEKGADCKGRSWGRLLVVAVENCYHTLITTLVDHGTSIDYENARAIRIVLRRNDLDLLQLLLRGRSSPQTLAKALPDAVHITEKEKRRGAILMLLGKGAKGPEMNIALLQSVTSSALRDLELVQALLQHGASVNHVDRNGNCIQVAVDNGDLELLSIFCEYNPSDRILSAAMRIAFDSAERIPQSDVLRIMDLLMSKGARGPEVAQTLIEVVRGNDMDILKLLLRRGADVNQQGGLVIEEALKATSAAALEEICKISRIEQETFTRLFPLALTESDNDFRAILLIRACRKYRSELSRILIQVVSQFAGREGLVKALLQNGATVNYDNGKALCHAIYSGNVKLIDWLTVDLEVETLSTAVRMATGIEDPKLRHEIMTLLLRGTSKDKRFGQDDALVLECQRGPKASLDVVNLLLQHGADVDHLKGAAVERAISAKSSELLRLLLSWQPNQTSLCTAFKAAREATCSLEKRLEFFKALLDKGYRGNQKNQALVEAITRSPKDEEIPRLLLEHEAEVDVDSGLPLILAARSGNVSLLRFLISKSSNPASLENSFRSARQASMSDAERLPVYSTLLNTKSVSQDEVSAALVDAVSGSAIDMKLIRLLSDHNTSLEFHNGEALCILVKRSDVATAAFLLENQIASTKTLNRTFEHCFELDRICRLSFANLLVPKGVSPTLLTGYLNQTVVDKDHNLMRLFLQYGADVELGGGKALITAASSGDPVSLQILLSNRVGVEAINAAFQGMLDSKAPDKYSGGVESARLLLEHGVSQILKDRALLEAVEHYCNQGDAFVRTLIEQGADVNVAEGRCFVITGRFENYPLFDAMLGFRAQLGTIIPALVMGIEEEDKLVVLIRRCLTHQSPHFDSANSAILFLAINRFPRGANLVELLLDSNCPAGVTQTLQLKANYESEDVTPLIWSLYQTDPLISDSVMLTLLTRGQEANPRYMTQTSCKTAIIKATKARRHTVLQRLIDLKVDVRIRNNKRKTAMFYASRNGDLKAIEMLIKAGAPQNDGSLHEAAREAHPDVVSLLLDNGYDPDYPSDLHFGRSALAEACLKAKPSGQNWESRVQQVMQLLLQAGTDLTEKYDGKTLLHLALDNDCALDVTSILLEFSQFWKRINEDLFLYQDSRHICYSPTKYVEEFYIGAEHGMRDTLVQLLKNKRCKDRLFSSRGEQIQGAIGLPADLEVMERRQTLASEEHARSMQRIREMAELQIELSNKAHDNNLLQAQKQEEYEIESGQRRNDKQIAWETARDRRRLRIAREEHEQELRNKAAVAVQESEIMSANRTASLDHMKKVALIEQSSVEAKVKAQSKLLDRQDQSLKQRAKEMKSIAEACKNTGLNQNSMKLLGDGNIDWRRDID